MKTSQQRVLRLEGALINNLLCPQPTRLSGAGGWNLGHRWILIPAAWPVRAWFSSPASCALTLLERRRPVLRSDIALHCHFSQASGPSPWPDRCPPLGSAQPGIKLCLSVEQPVCIRHCTKRFHSPVSGDSHSSVKRQGDSSSEKLGDFSRPTWLESG